MNQMYWKIFRVLGHMPNFASFASQRACYTPTASTQEMSDDQSFTDLETSGRDFCNE